LEHKQIEEARKYSLKVKDEAKEKYLRKISELENAQT